MDYSKRISAATIKLDAWIEGQNFRGWDPYDALNSRLLRGLTGSSRKRGQIVVQLLKRSPVNLRPLLGVTKGYNPKGMGLFLSSYWRKYQLTGSEQDLSRVHFFCDWLQANAAPGYSGACWGYNFDWPNRGFFAPAGTPTIVNTAFIALALLDLRHLPATVQPSGLPDPLPLARSACDFIMTDLAQIRPQADELCFAYTPLDRRFVHNANIMGAALLASVYALTGEPLLAEQAAAAARYTVRRQQADSSWLYGEGSADSWVDNFHTGFVLVGLRNIAASLQTHEFDAAIKRGYDFWKTRMFLADGAPKYYPDHTYPLDAHSVAQAVLTFLSFADLDPDAGRLARLVAAWGIEHLQDPGGFFHYQLQRFYKIRTPYMRWSQAWMQRALTEITWVESEKSGRRGQALNRVAEMSPVLLSFFS